MHEAQMHDRNCFVTLTYADEYLPPGGSLDVRHWQNFAKRLRNQIRSCAKANKYCNCGEKDCLLPRSFRFFHCGEYGPGTGRAHYHALIFGVDFHYDRKFLKTSKHGDNLYTSELLDELWGHGHCNIGSVTFKSAAYVARYCIKKISGKDQRDHYKIPGFERVNERTGEVFDFIKPPYTTMSRRPGIGKPWLDKYLSDVYPSDEVILNGQKSTPPAYYDTQLANSNPALMEQLKSQRKLRAEKHHKNNTPNRLRVRETIQELRNKQLKRDQH